MERKTLIYYYSFDSGQTKEMKRRLDISDIRINLNSTKLPIRTVVRY